MTVNTANRPKFLDLRKISLPLPGIVSILHRISGVLMVLFIPMGIYLLDVSLRDAAGFAAAHEIAASWWFKLLATVMIWSLAHHLCAGIRYLLLDVDVGVALKQARQSSIIVFVASVIITLLFLKVVW